MLFVQMWCGGEQIVYCFVECFDVLGDCVVLCFDYGVYDGFVDCVELVGQVVFFGDQVVVMCG